MDEKIYLALLHKLWITQKQLHLIFKDNQNYKCFYTSINYDRLKTYDFSQKQIEHICKYKTKITLKYIKDKLKNKAVKIITFKDVEYPDCLKQLNNKPYILYIRWDLCCWPKISVIWSRKITSYGKKCIDTLIPEIGSYFTIVSWWAAWCDSYAHECCLKNKLKTVSVVGTWIDIDYPTHNATLYNKIVESWWCVLSIFPIWEKWFPYNFPVRNEIVSALSKWIIVIEAAMKSGTLITVNLGLEMWRDIYALPGNFYSPYSAWCNKIISKWYAKCITSTLDVLEEYNIDMKTHKQQKINFEDNIEKKIYEYIWERSLTIDNISVKVWIQPSELYNRLSMMELKKIIKKSNDWKYEIF